MNKKKKQERNICMHLCVYIAVYKIHKTQGNSKKCIYLLWVHSHVHINKKYNKESKTIPQACLMHLLRFL